LVDEGRERIASRRDIGTDSPPVATCTPGCKNKIISWRDNELSNQGAIAVRNIYRSLLLLIAGATQKELARQVRYLKVENEILRSKLPKKVTVTPKERNRLVRFAKNLGSALSELATIVHPDTIRRWIREQSKKRKGKPAKVGRKRTAEEIEKLILMLAKDNGWGYTRILGELRKLGIKSISRNTVKNILKRNGHDPGPKRGVGTWDEFLKLHAETLWQCDFLCKKVLTPKGFRDLFLLVFLHVGTRRVFVSRATYHPNEAWVQDQAKAFTRHVEATGLGADIVMHDRDTKFTAGFDDLLENVGLRVKQTAPRAPNTVAFVERFIQTLEQECLDYFFVFGEKHMNYLVSEMVSHYHEERPHQAKGNELLVSPAAAPKKGNRKKSESPPDIVPLSEIHCRQRLGGLLKHYYRKAA
jgi:putative transposase